MNIFIIDYKSNDSQTATSDYTYKFFLENETELNLSKINEDLYIDFLYPNKRFRFSKF